MHVSIIILLGCEVGVVIESQTVEPKSSNKIKCCEQSHITKFLTSSVSSALACESICIVIDGYMHVSLLLTLHKPVSTVPITAASTHVDCLLSKNTIPTLSLNLFCNCRNTVC